jgi:hypothetical protein
MYALMTVAPPGLEPGTKGLVIPCSIQLSYGAMGSAEPDRGGE